VRDRTTVGSHDAASRSRHADNGLGIPLDSIYTARPRTVPRIGFADAQDDKLLMTSFFRLAEVHVLPGSAGSGPFTNRSDGNLHRW